MQALIAQIKRQFDGNPPIAHGFDHVERVAKLARYLAEKEGYDPEVAAIAGYLHDIGRTVQEEEKDHGPAGVEPARELLDAFTHYDEATKTEILHAVRDHSSLHTEGRLTHIVQDADMLDGMGAVGIMRAYTFKAALPCYDPENIVPREGRRDHTIHEQIVFQMEWIKLMHTEAAKPIAARRYRTMRRFLEDFKDEVEGKDVAKG